MTAILRQGSLRRRAGAVVVVVVAALCGPGLAPGQAQSLPGASGTDLTLPLEMRAGAVPPSAPQRPEKRRRTGKDGNHAVSETTTVARHAATEPSHPVELGVTVRGGSGTPRVYGATGTSEAIQEGGSAIGAGMRFGF